LRRSNPELLATPGLLPASQTRGRNDGQSQPVMIYGGRYKRATREGPEVANTATSAASPRSRAAHRSRCSTRSNFSTSLMAGQPRMASRALRAERHFRSKLGSTRQRGWLDESGFGALWYLTRSRDWSRTGKRIRRISRPRIRRGRADPYTFDTPPGTYHCRGI
jgi:hypothetical protein